MTDLDVLFGAVNCRGEAEGEGELGMELVAWVVRSRVGRPRWPGNVVAVVLDPIQFSFWNGDSRRRAELLTDRSPAHWNAVRIFARVWAADRDDDPTDGADHYFNPSLASPGWRRRMFRTLEFKSHVFYASRRDAEGNPRR